MVKDAQPEGTTNVTRKGTVYSIFKCVYTRICKDTDQH